MYVAIDSSHQLTYTGALSGSHPAIDDLFAVFEKIFRENNVAGKYHWSQLSNKTRGKLKRPLIKALSESNVNLNVLQHRKPRNVQRKDWFIFYLPSQIAQRLEHWLGGKGGDVELVVDDDYNLSNIGTDRFIEQLLRQLSIRLTGKEATIRKENKIKMTIKQANGKVLTFYSSVADRTARGISLVDVYLGLYISDPNAFENLKNVYYKELK